jgi:hypothetical protein
MKLERSTHDKWFLELSKVLHSSGYTSMRSSRIDLLSVLAVMHNLLTNVLPLGMGAPEARVPISLSRPA